MDVKMADLDGFSATRRLIADEATRNIPVIAVTASAFGDTRRAATDAGCADYLPKPVQAEALFGALQRHLGLEFVSGTPEATAAAVTPGAGAASRSARGRDCARRSAIGAITDLQAIADTLAAGDESDTALGRRIERLAANVDFAGVHELAASLESRSERHRC